ncbi:MAG: hypothetical protein JG774_326 [Desulfomicrobiaceae bacterium]|jgi:RND family efflux transporter MFP subunit|nr:hypothetical protein [Desulfomicrobiaceae bacterium]MBZ4684581.1 hypothetical protein [Desulfomicrobiaceae bacterium]
MTDPRPHRRATLLALGIALVALALGAGAAVYFVRTKPAPPQRPPASLAPSVEVIHPQPHHGPVTIAAMGTITPARQIALRAQVGGAVVAVSPRLEPGLVVAAQEELVRIDPRDYEAVLTQREAELAQAKAALEMEAGRRQVARKDWERLAFGDNASDPRLPLREPQWMEAQAAVRKAEANVALARLNLERTRVRAPFAAVVQEKNVHMGSTVSTQETLAVLTDATRFWVEASVPVEYLSWIAIPPAAPGAPVQIRAASGSTAQGAVAGLIPAVESGGRLARVRITLPRPLEATPPFLLGDSVEVAIQGRSIDGVRIPRESLREGDQVWLATNGTLEIRPVRVLFTDPQNAIVDGIAADEFIVSSPLAAPVPGMAITAINASAR